MLLAQQRATSHRGSEFVAKLSRIGGNKTSFSKLGAGKAPDKDE
jgi:hypothetical protein